MLQLASLPAERLRGAKFCEDFRDHLSMIKGGWTLTGAPTFAKGGGLVTALSKYASIPLGNELATLTITLHLEFIPTQAVDNSLCMIDSGGAKRFGIFSNGVGVVLISFDGQYVHNSSNANYNAAWKIGQRNVLTFTATSGGVATVWLNGVLLPNGYGARTYDGVASTPLYVGVVSGIGYFYGTFNRVLIGHYLCTKSEHDAYYNRTMFNWEDRCAINLQMRTQDYDPTAVRTLDSSGNGNHFTLGDGVTPAKYPTQGKGRMYFNATSPKYLQRASVAQPTGAFSVLFTVREDLTVEVLRYVGSHMDVAITDVVWLMFYYSGAWRFYVGGIGSDYAISNPVSAVPLRTLVGTWDGTTKCLYIDGVYNVAGAYGSTAPSGPAIPMVLGARSDAQQPWTGNIFDFKYITGEALNAVQVADYHQRQMSRLGAEQ